MLTEIVRAGIEAPRARDVSFEAESCPDGDGVGTAPIRSCSRSLPGADHGGNRRALRRGLRGQSF